MRSWPSPKAIMSVFASQVKAERAALMSKKDELYGLATENGKKLLDKFADLYAKMNVAQDETLRLIKVDKAKATEHSTNEGLKVATQALQSLEDYVAFLKKSIADRSEQAREDGAHAQLLVLSLVLASLVIAVGAAF